MISQQEHEQYETCGVFLKERDPIDRRSTQDARDLHIFSGATMGPLGPQLRAQAKGWPISKPEKFRIIMWPNKYLHIFCQIINSFAGENFPFQACRPSDL